MTGTKTEIILQGFDWNSAINYSGNYYRFLLTRIPDIKKAGFTSIWLPPPWKDSSPNQVGYFWQDFRKNSAYGTDEELRALASALHEHGIKIIYDIVLNHRNMHAESTGPWRTLPPSEQHANLEYKKHHNFDAFDQGQNDLNLNNERVQQAFIEELANLILYYNAEGFRFDFAKGYDPNSPRKLIEGVKAQLTSWNKPIPDLFLVGEYWDLNQNRLKTIWSDSSHCNAFDFPLQHQFHERVLSNERMKKGLNANPESDWRKIAVTFVDNHDTGYSECRPDKENHYHDYAPSKKNLFVEERLRARAYAYLLLTPGTPCVYWPHWNTWGEVDGLKELINDLIAVRKQAGIRADSPISFDAAAAENGILLTVVGNEGEHLRLGLTAN